MTMTVETASQSTSDMTVETVSDRARWDEICRDLDGSILQSWSWGKFKQRHGWSPHRIVLYCDGVASVAAQVLIRRIGPMSVAYIPRGPMHANAGIAAMSLLTVKIDELCRRNRAAVVFLEPDGDLTALPKQGTLAWQPSHAIFQPERTIKVPVNATDDELLSGMKSKTRYNVRLAGRRGVSVRDGSLTDLTAFYNMLEETSDRDEFGIHSVEYYADMIDVFGDDASLVLAEIDEEAAAGAIVLRHNDEAVYMFGASSQRHQRHMASYLVQFHAMQWARDRACSVYDLWGIPASDQPPETVGQNGVNVRDGLWGVYRFKQGFGGDVVRYPGVMERQYYPNLVKLWRRVRPGLG